MFIEVELGYEKNSNNQKRLVNTDHIVTIDRDPTYKECVRVALIDSRILKVVYDYDELKKLLTE